MAYATLAQLKTMLRITDTDDDTELQAALDAAEAQIDRECNRTFEQVSPATARTYEPWGRHVPVDDISSRTGLVVETGGVALVEGEGFELQPYDEDAHGRPWTWIRLAVRVLDSGLLGPEVKVTAEWGWPAVPAPISRATLLQASRLFARRRSPFGIAGSPEMGSELRLLARLDADVEVLVHPWVRHWGAV